MPGTIGRGATLPDRGRPRAWVELATIPFDPATGSSISTSRGSSRSETACVYVEMPCYLGTIETQGGEIAELAHDAGALFVVGVDPTSLGVLEAPPRYGADIVCGELQPLGIHMHYGGGLAGFVASPDEERFVAEYPTFLIGLGPTVVEGEYGFGEVVWERTSYVQRGDAKDFTGTTQFLWAIAAGVYLALVGPQGIAELGEGIMQRRTTRRSGSASCPASALRRSRGRSSRSSSSISTRPEDRGEVNRALRARGIFGGKDLSASSPSSGRARSTASPRYTRRPTSTGSPTRLRRCCDDAPSLPPGELERADPARASSPGERGLIVPRSRTSSGGGRRPARGPPGRASPHGAAGAARAEPAAGAPPLPPAVAGDVRNDVDIHLGLGTCTMKYSPKVNEELVRSREVADLHPLQDEETVQGMLEVIYRFERMLCEISGMSRFTFQPAGGSQAVYANARIMRAYHEARGEGQRDEIITTIFSHPCDGAGPATAGFKVITVYAGDRLSRARRAQGGGLGADGGADDHQSRGHGALQPAHRRDRRPRPRRGRPLPLRPGERQRHPRGHARPRRGFDLCQFNLHKTFSSPHASMGLPCGAAGVTDELAPYLPTPTVEFDG